MSRKIFFTHSSLEFLAKYCAQHDWRQLVSALRESDLTPDEQKCTLYMFAYTAITGERELAPAATIAAEVGMSEDAVRNLCHKLRSATGLVAALRSACPDC
jgi:hypothetical protein